MANDKNELKAALDEFDECVEHDSENHRFALDDLRFARLGEQWPVNMRTKREQEDRPCLTINRMPIFIRQVVNEGRRNKPAIKVHPADDVADPQTAEIINGLIRNIEYTSDAEVAYDTGLEFAVSGGFGYWRVGIEYSHDDTFDRDLVIKRIANPFSVHGDPYSTAADSSDWNICFITDVLSKSDFKRKYKGAKPVNWTIEGYDNMRPAWSDGEDLIIAERWKRSEVQKTILKLSDGRVVNEDWYLGEVSDGITNKDVLDQLGIKVIGDRPTKGWKVKQQIMSGAEILEENDWLGKYIPIVPVYGEELNIQGRRYFRSLIRDAKDPQRMFNYWRTTSTELVALAPKAPWVGPVGSFNTDADKWATANTESWSHIEYDVVEGAASPTRQDFAGPPAGALQEALNSSDDMKSVIGIFDASLGAQSNETSGVAINARDRQADLGTFHFLDNQNRAIRHTGRILIDLIPYVYNEERIVRIMGPDKVPKNVPVNQPVMGDNGQPVTLPNGEPQIFDLTVGKYDVTIDTGPSFATQREEAAYQMTEFIRAYPQAAPVLGDLLAKNQDWPDADEVRKRLQALLPPVIQGQNPQVQQLQQQLQQTDAHARQAVSQLQQKLDQIQTDKALEARKLDIDAYNAETNRIKAEAAAMTPQQIQALIMQTLQQTLSGQQIGVQSGFAPQGSPNASGAAGMQPPSINMPPNSMGNVMPPQIDKGIGGTPPQQAPNQPGQAPGFFMPDSQQAPPNM